jgi:hypothetical protein
MNIKADKFLQTIGKKYSEYIKIANYYTHTNKPFNPFKPIPRRYRGAIKLKYRSSGTVWQIHSGLTYGTYSGYHFLTNDGYGMTKYELDYYINMNDLVYFIRGFINRGYFVHILKRNDNIRLDYNFNSKKCYIYLSLESDKNLIRRAKLREILK